MKSTAVLAGFASLLLVAAANAQDRVTSRSFQFFDTRLTIDVVAEAGGVLRVMRGKHSSVEVSGRAVNGVAGFSIGGREDNELRLTAVGGDHADYLVIVPEDVRVRVRLPDRKHIEIASSRPAATYTWTATPTKSSGGGSGAQPPAGDAGVQMGISGSGSAPPAAASNGMFLSYFSESVPRTFAIGDLAALTRLEVRFEGSDFRVSTSRPVAVDPGRADAIDFRAGREPLGLTLNLPVDTRDFRLMADGRLVIEARNGEIRSFCDQFVAQKLADGRRLYTYLRTEGRLICR
jgi:hypothetical protein